MKTERIYNQQNCTTRNVKRNASDIKKMIPDGNLGST